MWQERCEDRIAKSDEVAAKSALSQEQAMDKLEEVAQLRRTLDANDYTIDRYKTLMQEKAAIFKAPQMKRRRTKGKRGGGSHWDEYAVQMVCELLVLGVPPTVSQAQL